MSATITFRSYKITGLKVISMIYCSGCGNEMHETAVACPSCGAVNKSNVIKGNKSKVVAGVLALFLGGLGVHKFYLGQTGLGILYLCLYFFGIFFLFIPTLIIGVIAFVEAIVYFCSSDENFDNKYNRIR